MKLSEEIAERIDGATEMLWFDTLLSGWIGKARELEEEIDMLKARQGAAMKIDQKQAAKYLGIAERSLESSRFRGGGPPFYKLGKRVVYDTADLDAWLARRKRTSTSDQPSAA